jgi:hypothetical protein
MYKVLRIILVVGVVLSASDAFANRVRVKNTGKVSRGTKKLLKNRPPRNTIARSVYHAKLVAAQRVRTGKRAKELRSNPKAKLIAQ